MATFPTPSGYPITTGTPTNAAITAPILFSAMVTENLHLKSIIPDITEEAEGQITGKGCQLYRARVPRGVVVDTAQGQTIAHPLQQWTNDVLTVNKAKTVGFAVDNLAQFQSNLNLMQSKAKEDSQALIEAVDVDFLGNAYGDADSHNYGTAAGLQSGQYNLGDLSGNTPVVVTRVNAAQYLVYPRAVLDEQKAPQDEMAWMVIPPVAATVLQLSDIKAVFLTGDKETALRNRAIGTWNRTTFYTNANLPSSTATVGGSPVVTFVCPFGLKRAISFAMQAQLTRTGDVIDANQKYQDTTVLYGYKCFQPEVLGYAYLSFSLA